MRLFDFLKRSEPGKSDGWDAIFAGIPTAANTETEQQRHRELREKSHMTEAEEAESNQLFFVIYPQLKAPQNTVQDGGPLTPGYSDPADDEEWFF